VADSNQPSRKRKAYQPPKLQTVEVIAEEALLALCVNDSGGTQSVMQGTMCAVCKS
jgi:hypothetical protein